jgi:hypothetical protein
MLKYPLTLSKSSKVRFSHLHYQTDCLISAMENIDIKYDETIASQYKFHYQVVCLRYIKLQDIAK